MHRFIAAVFGTAVMASLAAGQINLNYLSAQSTRNWSSAQTRVDSMRVETSVGNGLATTVVTLTVTPKAYQYCSSIYNSATGTYSYQPSGAPIVLDSIEIAANFTLPSDFAASGLWLWVNGVPQKGQIQDRMLANQQYTQIVNRRRDPALLEFYGSGSFSLKIFPARSNLSRKVAIEFRHTFDDDSAALITACLPFVFDTVGRYYSCGTSSFDPIGFMQAQFSATDGKSYTVNIPGLGSANFSKARPAGLTGTQIRHLGAGSIMAADPSGSSAEYLWTGKDERDGMINAGFTFEFSERNVTFDPEPDTRIIVIDIRKQFWDYIEYNALQSASRGVYYDYVYPSDWKPVDMLARAQKFAVLALQNYVSPAQKFNIIIAGAAVRSVFPAPVPATAANITQAYAAISSVKPSIGASTMAALKAAISQSSKAAVLLISDLYMPVDYYRMTTSGAYLPSASGSAHDSLLQELSNAVSTSSITLYTIDDEYRLLQVANASGGFRIAGIRNAYGIQYRYLVSDGKRLQIPIMPPLFGSYNPVGISALKITANDFASLVYTKDGYNYFPVYYGWNSMPVFMPDDVRLAKMALPSSYTPDAPLLRVAGKIPQNKLRPTHDFTITGKMGGLGFTRSLTAIANADASAFDVDKQWPFRYTEYLAAQDWSRYADAIKAAGKSYGIVTRQTSLLALEPGMALWVDTLVPASQPSQTVSSAGGERLAMVSYDAAYSTVQNGVSAPQSTVGSGMNIDDVALGELISLPLSARGQFAFSGRAGTLVRATRDKLEIVLSAADRSCGVSVDLYDAKGRLVLTKRLSIDEVSSGRAAVSLAGKGIGAGLYTVRLKSEAGQRLCRVSVF